MSNSGLHIIKNTEFYLITSDQTQKTKTGE